MQNESMLFDADCHKRNSVRRICKSGVKFVISLMWTTKPGFRDCHLTRVVAASKVRKYCKANCMLLSNSLLSINIQA